MGTLSFVLDGLDNEIIGSIDTNVCAKPNLQEKPPEIDGINRKMMRPRRMFGYLGQSGCWALTVRRTLRRDGPG